MAVTTPDMCRVTVVTPNRWADLALPAGEPLADLLPALLDHVGDADLDGRPLALQRLGSPPFDEVRSLAGNGVLDGETLYLNAADEVMPSLDFDDSIAGLGEGIEGLANRWKPLYTRRMLLSVAVLPAGSAWLVLAPAPTGAGISALIALVASLLLVLGSSLASRSWGDRSLALVLGGASLPFAALAGALGVDALGMTRMLSPAVGLSAAAAVFSIASVADMAVGGLSVGFAGAAFAAALTGVGCAVGLVVGWDAYDALALVLVLAVVSAEVLVSVACRLAGVWLPPLPRNADELEDGIEAVPAQEALTRAVQVDQYVTALLWGSAAVIVPTSVVLAGRGLWPALLVSAAAASSLLRLRVFYGHGQRAALLVAGVAGPVALLCLTGLFGAGSTRLWIAVALLGIAGLLFVAAVVLPGRRGLPHFGRAAEIFEGIVAATLLPLLLAVLGTYEAARNFR